MKNYPYNIALMICFLCWNSQLATAQYKITVSIEGYENDTCILGYQSGNATYRQNTVYKRDDKGHFVFKGEESLPGGLYSVITKPNNAMLQFLVVDDQEQQDLVLKTKIKDNPSRDLGLNLKVANSPDNQQFLDYKNFLQGVQKDAKKYSDKVAEAKKAANKEQEETWMERLKELDKKVKAYQLNMQEKHPNFLSTKLVVGSQQVELPSTLTDQTEIYRYYRQHFWDNFDWSDPRLIRTPLFKNKINTYLEKLTMLHVDSVTASCFYIIDKTLEYKDPDMFQFAAVELLNQYAKQKIICMDGVYVAIAQKYYCSGLATWIDSTQLKKICEDAAKMAPLRCGRSAPEARLKNIQTEEPISLYSIRKPFVAVYFWDPTCGNCSKMSKALIPVYNKYKDRGFEIYGVCSKSWKEVGTCKKKVEKEGMNWINTSDDPYPLAWVKKSYDLRVNPYIYLLDENKNILYKRINAEQLDQILEREFELYEKKKAEK